MNYEEKYNQAFDRASKLRVQNPFDTVGQMVEHIFPELAESEDEKIRKEIVDFITSSNKYGTNERCEAWLAWLEKQGEYKPYGQRKECEDCQFNYAGECKGYCALKRNEQKPILDVKASDWYVSKVDGKIHNMYYSVDKVEPKFKVGDWVIDNIGDIYQIEKATEIESEHIFGYTVVGGGYFNDNNNGVRLWTIQDTKDGDVLVDEDNNIGIFSGEKDDLYWHSCIYLGCDGYLRGSMGYHKHENTKPATKEQWDLLFSKMKEAGYEWDQKEKKPIKMKETKFKVGDWVVDDETPNDVFCVIEVLEEIYKVIDIDGDDYHIPHCKADNQFHLWTIADAKDGDLLAASDNSIFIYAGTDGSKAKFYVALTTFGTFNFEGGRWEDKDSVRPVTEEEHKTFFEKLKDKKLEWDLKNKCIHYTAFC